jgi:hypothetical protein
LFRTVSRLTGWLDRLSPQPHDPDDRFRDDPSDAKRGHGARHAGPAGAAPRLRTGYATWLRGVERYEITPETLLVGHSCGGGFLVRWLSGHPAVRVPRVADILLD